MIEDYNSKRITGKENLVQYRKALYAKQKMSWDTGRNVVTQIPLNLG